MSQNNPTDTFDREEWQSRDGRRKFLRKFSDKQVLFHLKRLKEICTNETKVDPMQGMTWTSYEMIAASQNEDLSLIGRLKAVGYYEVAEEAKSRGLIE